MGEAAEYWGVLVSIVPVFALALIIEQRALARQYSKDSGTFRTTRPLRITNAVTGVIGGVGLVVSFWISLAALRIGLPADGWQSYVAELGVLLALGSVVISPLLLLTQALLHDVFTAIHRRMPYSSVRRAAREVRRLDEAIRKRQVDRARERIDALLALSDLYVVIYADRRQAARRNDVAEVARADRYLDTLDELRSSFERTPDEQREILADVDRLLESAASKLRLSDDDFDFSRSVLATASEQRA